MRLKGGRFFKLCRRTSQSQSPLKTQRTRQTSLEIGTLIHLRQLIGHFSKYWFDDPAWNLQAKREEAFQHSYIQYIRSEKVPGGLSRLESTEKVLPSDFIIMEGRLLLHMEKIKRHINFSIYLDTDLDILLSRRIYRSLLEKQPLEEVIRRYRSFVKKNHEHFVEPVASWVT